MDNVESLIPSQQIIHRFSRYLWHWELNTFSGLFIYLPKGLPARSHFSNKTKIMLLSAMCLLLWEWRPWHMCCSAAIFPVPGFYLFISQKVRSLWSSLSKTIWGYFQPFLPTGLATRCFFFFVLGPHIHAICMYTNWNVNRSDQVTSWCVSCCAAALLYLHQGISGNFRDALSLSVTD